MKRGSRESGLDVGSTIDVSEPISEGVAKNLIREILKAGHNLSFSDHAVEEMEKDDMDMVDVVNVLRGCQYIDPAEQHVQTGSWTYRVHTSNFCVVVAFRSTTKLRLVTAWRKKKR